MILRGRGPASKGRELLSEEGILNVQPSPRRRLLTRLRHRRLRPCVGCLRYRFGLHPRYGLFLCYGIRPLPPRCLLLRPCNGRSRLLLRPHPHGGGVILPGSLVQQSDMLLLVLSLDLVQRGLSGMDGSEDSEEPPKLILELADLVLDLVAALVDEALAEEIVDNGRIPVALSREEVVTWCVFLQREQQRREVVVRHALIERERAASLVRAAHVAVDFADTCAMRGDDDAVEGGRRKGRGGGRGHGAGGQAEARGGR